MENKKTKCSFLGSRSAVSLILFFVFLASTWIGLTKPWLSDRNGTSKEPIDRQIKQIEHWDWNEKEDEDTYTVLTKPQPLKTRWRGPKTMYVVRERDNTVCKVLTDKEYPIHTKVKVTWTTLRLGTVISEYAFFPVVLSQ